MECLCTDGARIRPPSMPPAPMPNVAASRENLGTGSRATNFDQPLLNFLYPGGCWARTMSEAPRCVDCGHRHWFLDPCGVDAGAGESRATDPDPAPAPGEVARAVRYYRAHLKRERDRMRAKRSGPPERST